MKLIFATNNAHKLREVSQVVGDKFTLLTPRECGIDEDIPEEQPTLEGNALQKARYIYARTGMDCFADDTGLEVDALAGEPGVRSARYATDGHDDEANKRLLLERMQGVEQRKRSTAMGFFQAVYGVGMTLGPMLTGAVADGLGMTAAYFTMAAFAVIGIVIVIFANRRNA